MFAATAAEQGLLREGVLPDDALRWLQIVATGLVRQPDLVPDPADLTTLLRLMLLHALLQPPDGSDDPRPA